MAPELSIELPIKTILYLGFYITTLIYVIFSVILYYHWQAYSAEPKITRLTFFFFFFLSLPLITTLGLITLNLN